MKAKLPRLILFFFVLTTVFSFAGRIFVLNKYLTKGNDVKNYEEELNLLTKENNLLAGKIAEISSLTHVEDQALKLGMISPSSTAFLTAPIAASAIKPQAAQF